MSDDLEQSVRTLEADFLVAVGRGEQHVLDFCNRLDELQKSFHAALLAGAISQDLARTAYTVFASIVEHAQIVRSADSGFNEISQSYCDGDSDNDAEVVCNQLSTPRASLPLLRYFMSNICFPYPDAQEKDSLVEQVRELGWRDFDKKKLEDWFNRKRNQSGFVAVLRTYCRDDREAMRRLVHVALFGSSKEKDRLPDGALDDIEDMRDFIQSQCDELAEVRDSVWVDDLATGMRTILGAAYVPDEDSFRQLESDEDDEEEDDECDSASDWSDTDVEDDDEEPSCVIIGAKRKLSDHVVLSPPSSPQPPLRSLSIASSTSSSSTACSLRSFSGVSTSSTSTVEWDDDDTCDRPAKRSRSDSFSPVPESIPLTSASDGDLPSSTAGPSALFTSYRTKRKPTHPNLAARMRSMKRSRYALLGVASQANSISDSNLAALSGICGDDWAKSESTVADFNVDAYAVECTQPDYEVEVEDLVVFAREDDEFTEDTVTWSKLQVYTIFRMILPSAVRPLPPALAHSTTLSFDSSTLAEHDVVSLGQLLALTPDDIAAMYSSMNAVAPLEPLPSATAEVASPPEDSPSPTSSSSSSDCSSPPALSDDSGSSTRSSSVEPGSEQDSLLMSPTALSADYNQLYNELFSGKTLHVDPSQLNMELGEVPQVDIAADELSGAADLLARYLQDSMIAA